MERGAGVPKVNSTNYLAVSRSSCVPPIALTRPESHPIPQWLQSHRGVGLAPHNPRVLTRAPDNERVVRRLSLMTIPSLQNLPPHPIPPCVPPIALSRPESHPIPRWLQSHRGVGLAPHNPRVLTRAPDNERVVRRLSSPIPPFPPLTHVSSRLSPTHSVGPTLLPGPPLVTNQPASQPSLAVSRTSAPLSPPHPSSPDGDTHNPTLNHINPWMHAD